MPSSFSNDPVHEPNSIDEAEERKIYLDFLYAQATSDSPPFFGTNASILFHADIVDRAFGSALLSVSRLEDWSNSKGLHLITKPPICDFKFVQVEALLCAIERAASDGLTQPQAENIVRVSKTLADNPAADIAASWLIGANAHQQWRELIGQAVQHYELTLLDFGSKLPIDTSPQQSSGTPAPVVTATGAPPLKQASQEARILELLKAQGYDPINLAQRIPGKPGPKAEIRTLALTAPNLFTKCSFNKAWERLRSAGEIVGAE